MAGVVEDFCVDSVSYQLLKVKFPPEKWHTLAQGLRIARVVSKIDADHRDVAGKLQAVISHWVQNATQHNQWITLVEAVIMCDECGVAEQLATAVGVEYTPPPPPPPPPTSHSGSRGNHPVATDDDGGPSPAENAEEEPGDQDGGCVDELTQQTLTIEDLLDVLEQLSELTASKYKNLGLKLGLLATTLSKIEERQTCDAFGWHVMEAWLNQEDNVKNPTWKSLIAALETPIVGQKVTAQQVRQWLKTR